jgi:hypothetical protein
MKNPFWRKPDLCIGGESNPYMRRWYVIPRNKWFNIYLHNILRDDDDRALHDHPWCSLSFMLKGAIVEHYQDRRGDYRTRLLKAPRIVYRGSTFAHRLQLGTGSAWTLFITGRNVRDWGFHCPKGWVHWRDFTSGPKGETIGRGCGEMDDQVSRLRAIAARMASPNLDNPEELEVARQAGFQIVQAEAHRRSA